MKSKLIKIIQLALSCLAINANGIARQYYGPGEDSKLNPKLEVLVKPQSSPGWVDFRENTSLDPTTMFTTNKDAFDLSANDQMKIKTVEKDQLGYSHFRFDQYFKGLRVVYGEYIVHQQGDGFVRTANGRLITGLNLMNNPSLSESQALAGALRFMNAKKYLWQDEAMEKDLKAREKNEKATYYPKGELVYAPGNNDGTYKPEEYRLAWNFRIYTDDDNVTAKSVYVDAVTGRVNHFTEIAMNCSGG